MGIKGWRGTILQIAIQEMVHMSLACNLLTAVGGSPHLRRPNLPVSPKAYPPSFSLELVPFCRETLDGFVFIERPEDQEGGDGDEVGTGAPSLQLGAFSDIFSSERQYQTVGHLYRGIEDGLRYLTQKVGEDGLFLGPPGAQIADAYFSMPGLIPVTDLASAEAAILGIVEQGEGARGDSKDSHYGRFRAMQQEYALLQRDDPKFEPGRLTVRNPYSMLPNDVGDAGQVSMLDDPLTSNICNLFDGCYALLMQMLGRLLLHTGETEAQLVRLSDVTVGLMMDVMGPLGDALTMLSAGPSHPGLAAGPSFRLTRDVSTPPHQSAAWALFVERLRELSAYIGFLQTRGVMPSVLKNVSSYAQDRCLSPSGSASSTNSTMIRS